MKRRYEQPAVAFEAAEPDREICTCSVYLDEHKTHDFSVYDDEEEEGLPWGEDIWDDEYTVF